jgi:hypothetical protein
MFGKPLSQYLDFQKVILGLLAAVGLARLGLSLAGVSNTAAAFLSMNVVAWAGALYYGLAADRHGFTSYKQLLPPALFQTLVMQSIAVLGILLAIAGFANVYAAPEYSFGARSQWIHALAHVTIGVIAPTLLIWGVASVVRLITTKMTRRPAVA